MSYRENVYRCLAIGLLGMALVVLGETVIGALVMVLSGVGGMFYTSRLHYDKVGHIR